jgi:hypothetical protein
MIGFGITSPNRPLTELRDLAYYKLAPRLYRLLRVAETRIVGAVILRRTDDQDQRAPVCLRWLLNKLVSPSVARIKQSGG